MDGLNSSLTGTIRLTGSIAATLCLVVISLILLLLIFHKTYTSTLQRLILYLMIFTAVNEACLSAGYATQFEYSGHKMFCDMISVVWQWSDTVDYLLTFGMIVYLPYKVYERFKGDPFPRLSRSKYFLVALECLFIFVVLVLPLTYILPFIHCGYYPLQAQLCRMSTDQAVNQVGEYCTYQLFISSLVLSIVSFIDLIGIFVITTALSVVFCCLTCKYRETRKALCRTLILLGFFVAYTIIGLVYSGVLIGVSFGNLDTSLELLTYSEVVSAAILPVTQLIYPFSFLFYLYSFNLFHWRAIKRAAAEWRCFCSCCGRENALRVDQIPEAATAPSSHQVLVPSITVFYMPHSRITTDVPNEEQQALVQDGDGDSQYGTVMNS